MSEVSKNVKAFLKTGEKVQFVLTGNSYTSSSSAIIRFLAAITRIITVILGCPTRKSVVCTNKRLITENNSKILYFFDYSSSIVAVAPRGLMQIGYQFQRSWIIFKNHYLTLVLAGSPQELILSKNGYNGVMNIINAAESLREKVN
tara:strand:- start:64 stop:501 length:438 start_codon:yes stop_codon:yes gene_type:complete